MPIFALNISFKIGNTIRSMIRGKQNSVPFYTTPPQTQNSNFCIIILGICEYILLQFQSEFNLCMELRL